MKNLDTTPSWFNFAIHNDNNNNKRTFLAPLQLLWGLVLMNGELICLYLYWGLNFDFLRESAVRVWPTCGDKNLSNFTPYHVLSLNFSWNHPWPFFTQTYYLFLSPYEKFQLHELLPELLPDVPPVVPLDVHLEVLTSSDYIWVIPTHPRFIWLV